MCVVPSHLCVYPDFSRYERFAWIPIVIVYLIAVGINAHRIDISNSLPSPSAAKVLSFGSTVAGFVISYSGLSSDFTTYMRANVSSHKVFWYTYLGFMTPIVSLPLLFAKSHSPNLL